MRLLLIVFPETREDEVRGLIDRAGAGGWTEVRHLVGRGESGVRLGSTIWPGYNSACLAAVDEDVAYQIEFALREAKHEWEHTHRVPFNVHAFAMPCEQLI